jgi:uncharacterized membrane protein YfcA
VSLAAAVALGVLIGIALGALGGGGSILAVPLLVHLAGQSPAAATATSLVAVGAASVAAALRHARTGNVRWGAAGVFVVTGVPGSWLGAALNARLDGDVLLLVFSGLVLVAAHRMLTACPSCTQVGGDEALAADPVRQRGGAGTLVAARRTAPPRRRVAPVVATGMLVGFLTGLFGVGGGFVIVPALTLALGLPMPAAIGTSLAVHRRQRGGGARVPGPRCGRLGPRRAVHDHDAGRQRRRRRRGPPPSAPPLAPRLLRHPEPYGWS